MKIITKKQSKKLLQNKYKNSALYECVQAAVIREKRKKVVLKEIK